MSQHDDKIDYQFPEFEMDLEPGRVSLFRKAIGETGKAEVGDPVPPTLLGFGFEPEPFDILELFDIDIGNLLHGEQEVVHHKPCYVGDRLRGRKMVANAFEKKGGALLFVILKLTYRDDDGELVCESTQTLVVRRAVQR